MIDVPAVLRSYLVAQAPLATLTGTRIWSERSAPIAGYKPADGGAIAFLIRGGAVLYRGGVGRASVQFKCYGVDELTANAVYRALYDVLNNSQGPGIKNAFIDILGQSLTEPETGWPFVLTYYTVWTGV